MRTMFVGRIAVQGKTEGSCGAKQRGCRFLELEWMHLPKGGHHCPCCGQHCAGQGSAPADVHAKHPNRDFC